LANTHKSGKQLLGWLYSLLTGICTMKNKHSCILQIKVLCAGVKITLLRAVVVKLRIWMLLPLRDNHECMQLLYTLQHVSGCKLTGQYLVHFILEILKDVITLGQRLLKLVVFLLIHGDLPRSSDNMTRSTLSDSCNAANSVSVQLSCCLCQLSPCHGSCLALAMSTPSHKLHPS